MKIIHATTAGTMESSDAMVTVSPAENGINLSISSPVIHQYGEQIKSVVMQKLIELDVKDAEVTVVDRGALDCTLKARVEGAVFRAADASSAGIAWGDAVK